MKEAVVVVVFVDAVPQQKHPLTLVFFSPKLEVDKDYLSFTFPLAGLALYCTERMIQQSCQGSIPISYQTRGSMAIQISVPNSGINSGTTVFKIETGSRWVRLQRGVLDIKDL